MSLLPSHLQLLRKAADTLSKFGFQDQNLAVLQHAKHLYALAHELEAEQNNESDENPLSSEMRKKLKGIRDDMMGVWEELSPQTVKEGVLGREADWSCDQLTRWIEDIDGLLKEKED